MTNRRPEERETKARHYRGKKMVTAKKATTNRTKSEFISTLSNRAAKTNVLFPACFAHARYSSWMIGRFLNLGDHGKPKSGKIKGRCQPIQSASSRYCKRQLVIKNNTGDWSQSESAKKTKVFTVTCLYCTDRTVKLYNLAQKGPYVLQNCFFFATGYTLTRQNKAQ